MRRKVFFVMVMMIGCMILLKSEKVYAAEDAIAGGEKQTGQRIDSYEQRDGKIRYSPEPNTIGEPVSLANFTDEQKLQILMEIDNRWDFDADLVDWWIAFPCDDQMKYNYFISRESVVFSRTACNWIINNDNFTMEQKVQYIRSRDFWGCDYLDIMNWWYVNVGQPLSSYETKNIDARNYEQYLRLSYLDKYGVFNMYQIEVVYTSDKAKSFYILKEDCQKAVAEGLIKGEVHYYSICDSTDYHAMTFYTTDNYDGVAKKYKIWNYK